MEPTNFRLDSRDEMWVTGMVNSGPHETGPQWVREMWRDFFSRDAELPEGLDRSAFISPCHGRETEFTCYLGHASSSRPVSVPDGMVSIRIPPHEYAVATVSGSQDDVRQTYADLPAWAKEQGRQWNTSLLWLEFYRESPHPIGERIDLEIWLPLL